MKSRLTFDRIKMLENVMHRLLSKTMMMQNVKRKMREVVKMHRHRQHRRRNSVYTRRRPENSLVRYRIIQAIPKHGITIVTVTITIAIKVKIKVLENIELAHRPLQWRGTNDPTKRHTINDNNQSDRMLTVRAQFFFFIIISEQFLHRAREQFFNRVCTLLT